MELDQGTACSRYTDLSQSREPFLKRARDCSKLTIPALIPPNGFNYTSDFNKPFQSIGARGVNNLAGKLVMALLPPTQPFFRLRADPSKVSDAAPQETDQIDETLSTVEQRIMAEMESRAVRVYSFEAFKHLIVAGNVLMHAPRTSKGIRVFSLDKYVVMRDGEGNPLEIIVKERVSWRTLPATEGFRDSIKQQMDKDKSSDKNVDLYTVVSLTDTGGNWTVHQEVLDQKVPGSDGTYASDKLPWLPLRWTRIDGEDYGRSHCDEYIGDLLSLEGLAEAIVEASAAAARVLFLVAPNSQTSEKDLQEAPNLAVRTGNKEDVTVLSLEKFADMQVAAKTASELESRLSYAFLMNSAIQRQAERVTAEEIRYMANEIENALGGVYSVLSDEFQKPLVNIIMTHMVAKGQIPPLPPNVVNVSVITGLDALGRNQELMRLDLFIDGIEQRFPNSGEQYISVSTYMKRRAAALGVEDNGLIKTDQEVQAAQQAAQMNAAAQTAVPNMVKAISDHSLAAQQAAQQQQQTGEQP